MTTQRAPRPASTTNALARFSAMFVKEFIQLKRDRITFATMIMIPLMQLFLFGFAINNNPKHLPTAVLMQEDSDLGPLDPVGAAQHLVLRHQVGVAR